jgi:lipoyl(octanoyl) transferase
MTAPESPVGWTVSDGLVPYQAATAFMERRAADILDGRAGELVWLLEHPPLYTAGTSAKPHDLLQPDRFPVHRSGRGGEYTYHGPGQRVAYLMLDLRRRGRDVRRFVEDLEAWLIAALAEVGVTGAVRDGRVGVWVARDDPPREEKIAALGVRVRRWITFHGISLNVDPDLSHFDGIVPCGQRAHGVCSLRSLGVGAGMDEMDAALRRAFEPVFGATADAPPPEIAAEV